MLRSLQAVGRVARGQMRSYAARPTKPANGYLQYIKAEMTKRPEGVVPKDYLKQIGSQWSQMGQWEKDPFFQKYEADKREYKAALEQYTSERNLKPKRPTSAYMHFIAEAYGTGYEGYSTPQEKMSQVSKDWMAMSDESRQKYKDAEARSSEIHKGELSAWEEIVGEENLEKIKEIKSKFSSVNRPSTYYNMAIARRYPVSRDWGKGIKFKDASEEIQEHCTERAIKLNKLNKRRRRKALEAAGLDKFINA